MDLEGMSFNHIFHMCIISGLVPDSIRFNKDFLGKDSYFEHQPSLLKSNILIKIILLARKTCIFNPCG